MAPFSAVLIASESAASFASLTRFGMFNVMDRRLTGELHLRMHDAMSSLRRFTFCARDAR